MQTQLIHGDTIFADLANEWDALVGESMTDSPFQMLAYQRAWWQYLQPANSSLHSLVVRDDNGRLSGIACFYLLDGTIHWNASVEESDYLDLIARAEDAEAVWTAVWDGLCCPEFPTWNALDLYNIPSASPSRQILPSLAQARGFLLSESVIEVCPVITLPSSFDGYLETLDGKQRHELRRKLRRAEGEEVKWVQIGPNDNLAEAVDTFLTLLQKSTPHKEDWLNDGRRALFHATAQAALANGTLQLLFAEHEGQKGAALFNFDYKGRIWVYNSGLDASILSSVGLGVVLTAKAIEIAIGNGRSVFDFLRGNEAYKYRFGAVDTCIYRLQAQRK